MIKKCVACLLKNHNAKPSLEFPYSFPVDAPFLTVHFDCWAPGIIIPFKGFVGLMIMLCHMTGFAAIEPLTALNSKKFHEQCT